jgi:uncharacterized membrane protein
MQTSPLALLTILGMAIITYLTRISGLWLIRYMPTSKRFKAWLEYVPGAVIVSIIAPTVFSTNLADVGAAIATLLVALRTRNALLSLIIGVIVVIILRRLLGIVR